MLDWNSGNQGPGCLPLSQLRRTEKDDYMFDREAGTNEALIFLSFDL